MDSNCKRYVAEFGIAMAAYTVLVPSSIWLLRAHQHSPLSVIYALFPVLPAACAMWAGIRYVRSLDELQRRIQFEATAFSFLGGCLIWLTWGFLQNAGLPHADVVWVAPLLILLWGIGCAIARRRYR